MAGVLLATVAGFVIFWLVLDIAVSMYAAWIFYRLRGVQAAVLRELQRAERACRRARNNRSD